MARLPQSAGRSGHRQPAGDLHPLERGTWYYARCWRCGLTNRGEMPGELPRECGHCGWAFPLAGHSYPQTFAMGTGDGRRFRNKHPVGYDG